MIRPWRFPFGYCVAFYLESELCGLRGLDGRRGGLGGLLLAGRLSVGAQGHQGSDLREWSGLQCVVQLCGWLQAFR